MGQLQTIIIIVLFWVISFVEPSGWAMLLKLPEKINLIIALASTVLFVVYRNRRLPISQSLFWCIVLFIGIIPCLQSSTWQGASYLSSFLATYIVAQGKITERVIKWSAYAIAGLGILILHIYVHGSILSGWNDNAMSMVGLFSYLYFSIYLIAKRGSKSFWFWNIITVVYLQLLFQTDCRSGMLFSIVAVIAIYFAKQTRRIAGNKTLRLILLNIPLIISLIVMAVAASPFFDELNHWSIQNLEKSIFNGRDILWTKAYEMLEKTDYLGTGKFMLNYHNSGVAAISVFGVAGYICWIKFFSTNLNALSRYLNDNIVFGAMLAFLLIFLQQSVDLGFIAEYPNLLPYTILGIGLGRIRLIRQNQNRNESKCYNTNL